MRYFTKDAAIDSSRIAYLFMLDPDRRWFQWTSTGWSRLPDAAAYERDRALQEGSDILMNEVTKEVAEQVAARLFTVPA